MYTNYYSNAHFSKEIQHSLAQGQQYGIAGEDRTPYSVVMINQTNLLSITCMLVWLLYKRQVVFHPIQCFGFRHRQCVWNCEKTQCRFTRELKMKYHHGEKRKHKSCFPYTRSFIYS